MFIILVFFCEIMNWSEFRLIRNHNINHVFKDQTKNEYKPPRMFDLIVSEYKITNVKPKNKTGEHAVVEVDDEFVINQCLHLLRVLQDNQIHNLFDEVNSYSLLDDIMQAMLNSFTKHSMSSCVNMGITELLWLVYCEVYMALFDCHIDSNLLLEAQTFGLIDNFREKLSFLFKRVDRSTQYQSNGVAKIKKTGELQKQLIEWENKADTWDISHFLLFFEHSCRNFDVYSQHFRDWSNRWKNDPAVLHLAYLPWVAATVTFMNADETGKLWETVIDSHKKKQAESYLNEAVNENEASMEAIIKSVYIGVDINCGDTSNTLQTSSLGNELNLEEEEKLTEAEREMKAYTSLVEEIKKKRRRKYKEGWGDSDDEDDEEERRKKQIANSKKTKEEIEEEKKSGYAVLKNFKEVDNVWLEEWFSAAKRVNSVGNELCLTMTSLFFFVHHLSMLNNRNSMFLEHSQWLAMMKTKFGENEFEKQAAFDEKMAHLNEHVFLLTRSGFDIESAYEQQQKIKDVFYGLVCPIGMRELVLREVNIDSLGVDAMFMNNWQMVIKGFDPEKLGFISQLTTIESRTVFASEELHDKYDGWEDYCGREVLNVLQDSHLCVLFDRKFQTYSDYNFLSKHVLFYNDIPRKHDVLFRLRNHGSLRLPYLIVGANVVLLHCVNYSHYEKKNDPLINESKFMVLNCNDIIEGFAMWCYIVNRYHKDMTNDARSLEPVIRFFLGSQYQKRADRRDLK